MDGTACNPVIENCCKPSRDSFLMIQYLERHSVSSDQHVKELMPLREGLHVGMQCYMGQHFADRCWLHEHPGGHASWREPTRRKFTKGSITYFMKGPICRWNVQKMRSESSEYMWKTTDAFFFFLKKKKQLANQNNLGETTLKNMHRQFGREIG